MHGYSGGRESAVPEDGALFWDVRALYSPFLRIEVVGAVADVLLEADGHSAVGQYHEATRRVLRQHDSLLAQVGDGLLVADVNAGKSVFSE